jgi:hypothetical protein
MNRTIIRRLKQLESRLSPGTKPFEFVIHFIETGSSAVVSTLTFKEGRQEWWHSENGAIDAPLIEPGEPVLAARGI